jgi:hypothetical protein
VAGTVQPLYEDGTTLKRQMRKLWQLGDFQLSEIERVCPGVGREWIRSLLSNLKASGEVSCRGKGPAARWRYLGNNHQREAAPGDHGNSSSGA